MSDSFMKKIAILAGTTAISINHEGGLKFEEVTYDLGDASSGSFIEYDEVYKTAQYLSFESLSETDINYIKELYKKITLLIDSKIILMDDIISNWSEIDINWEKEQKKINRQQIEKAEDDLKKMLEKHLKKYHRTFDLNEFLMELNHVMNYYLLLNSTNTKGL